MDLIKKYAKAIAAWMAGVILGIITELMQGSSPWPQTGTEWGKYLLLSFGSALAVAVSPANKLTAPQMRKQLPDMTEPEQAAVADKALEVLPDDKAREVAKAQYPAWVR